MTTTIAIAGTIPIEPSSLPRITALSPAIEPTAKSMYPDISRIALGTARMAITEVCSSTNRKLDTVRNRSERKAKKAIELGDPKEFKGFLGNVLDDESGEDWEKRLREGLDGDGKKEVSVISNTVTVQVE